MNIAFPEILIVTFYIFIFTHFKVFFPNLCFDLFFTHLLVELIHLYVFDSCHFLHLLPSLFHCVQIIFCDGFTYLKFIETD